MLFSPVVPPRSQTMTPTEAADTTTRTLPPFSLRDGDSGERRFPSGRHTLLCFVKEDCPTCRLSMPLIEAAHRAFGEALDIWAIGQDAAGNARLVDEFGLSVPMLDDSALRVSYAYDLDTVPTVILADGTGVEQRRFVGFGKADWLELVRELARLSGSEAPAIDWTSYP